MEGVAAKINARAPKSRNEIKPKTHHFFYVLVWLAGWLAPPLAVVIRFGVGRDFFINILCTICGYFPGHFHNFYCQTIRNNKTAARTPKWAIKYGLVEVRDKRGGKHQWAGRYDERLPDSARNDYADGASVSSSPSQQGAWDGRGPEPSSRRSKNGGGSSGHHGLGRLAPWDQAVDPDEVEGGASRPASVRNGSNGGAYDPLSNEQFFASTADTSSGRPSSVRSKKSKKGIKGLLSHRDRYENQGPPSGDRFDKMNAARRPQDDYQDDFERELNSGSRGGTARFDSFEQEGPEDAWASSRPAGQKNGASAGAPNSASAAPTSNRDPLAHDF